MFLYDSSVPAPKGLMFHPVNLGPGTKGIDVPPCDPLPELVEPREFIAEAVEAPPWREAEGLIGSAELAVLAGEAHWQATVVGVSV